MQLGTNVFIFTEDEFFKYSIIGQSELDTDEHETLQFEDVLYRQRRAAAEASDVATISSTTVTVETNSSLALDSKVFYQLENYYVCICLLPSDFPYFCLHILVADVCNIFPITGCTQMK